MEFFEVLPDIEYFTYDASIISALRKILLSNYNYEVTYNDTFIIEDKEFWYHNVSLLMFKFIPIRKWLVDNGMEDFRSWTNKEKVLFKLRWCGDGTGS